VVQYKMSFRIWKVVPQEQVPPAPSLSIPITPTLLPPTPPPSPTLPFQPSGDIATVDTSFVLSMLPSHVQLLASHLLYFLKNNSEFKWNDRLEIVFKDKLFPNSNLVDLLIHVCESDRKNTKKPEGHKVFLQALDESNVPKSYIKDPECTRWLCFEDTI